MSEVFGENGLVLSATSIVDWKTCRRKWQLIHVEGWEPFWLSESLVAGSIFHEWVAATIRNQQIDTSFHPLLVRVPDPGEVRAKARAALRIWQTTQKEDEQSEILSVEVPFKASVGDILWAGRIDQIVKDETGIYIVDLKLTAYPRFDWFQNISDQLLIYAYFVRHAGYDVIGGIWDIISIPRIRRKKGETVDEYEDRLYMEAMSQGARVQLPRVFSREDYERIEEEIVAIAEEIKNGRIYRNPGACFSIGCVYAPICLNSSQAENLGFIRREGKEFHESPVT